MAEHRPGDFRHDLTTIWGCPCGFRATYQKLCAHRFGYRKRPECSTGPIFQVDPPPGPETSVQHLTPMQAISGVWGCPCGRRGTYQSIVGHRRGYRDRPACAAGPMFQVDAPSEILAPPLEPPKPPTDPDKTYGGPNNPTVFDTENTANEGAAQEAESEVDPEEVARQLNLQKRAMDLGTPPPMGPTAAGGFDASLPPEDWVLRGPDGEVHVSQLRESVSIPVTIRVFYDWARQAGWFQGDGSLSSFVADCLLDYFANVLGKVLVVADKEEMGVGG